jgi:hypothetical protein
VTEDDIRLMRHTNPAEVARMRTEDQASLIVGALKCLGGSADANRLKLFLISAGLIAPKDWTVFWRKAKPACEKDPRIDHSRAFEQFYRLAPEKKLAAARAAARGGDEPEVATPVRTDVPLPAYEVRKPDKTNLNTLRKFLAQHPGLEMQLKGRFGRFVQRITMDHEADRSDRARAGLYFVRWYPEQREVWLGVVRSLWGQPEMSISDLTTEDEQLQFLEDSRTAGVRRRGRPVGARLALLGCPRGRREGARAARRPRPRPAAPRHDRPRRAVPGRRAAPDRGGLRHAHARRRMRGGCSWRRLQLIEDKPKPSTGEKVLRWIDGGGAFEKLLAGHTVGRRDAASSCACCCASGVPATATCSPQSTRCRASGCTRRRSGCWTTARRRWMRCSARSASRPRTSTSPS